MKAFKEIILQSYLDLTKNGYSKLCLDLLDSNFNDIPIRKKVVIAMITFDVFSQMPEIGIAVLRDGNDYDETMKKYMSMNDFNIELFHTEDEAIPWLRKPNEEMIKL